MRTYRSKAGPFAERPFYKDEEIEVICTDELRAADMFPYSPSPIRIDRFLEKRFGVVPEYEDLPDGVLGLTKFGVKGVQGIVVARELDEEGTATAERRIRATLAHEAGHGLLHAHLFAAVSKEQSLFGDFTDPRTPKILCRDVPHTSPIHKRGYDGRWWEFQANRAIGALLLPKPLVHLALGPLLETAGQFGSKVLRTDNRERGISLLADTFDVNPIAARIRLQELYPVSNEAQLRL
ncbi:MAG: ImmA/IrrE family metallo-endopeptidase [Terriglobales bacterium]